MAGQSGLPAPTGLRRTGRLAAWGTAALLAAFATASPAAAGTPLMVGSALSFDGVKVEITSCSFTLPGWFTLGCGLGGFEMSGSTAADGSAQLVIDGIGNQPIYSYTGRGTWSGTYFDLQVTERITTTRPGATIDGATFSMVASSTSNRRSAITGSANLSGPAGSPIDTLSIDLRKPSDTSGLFSGVSTLNVTKDLRVTTSNLGGVNTLILSSVTQSFHFAPEPASIAVFLVGTAGLGLLRRRARRRRG
ncbi:MAG: hypothetical protein BGO51_04300 [Rhodospirillales bacterium 69-11]|nr:MAG: hypothetical protein BGO51_04300 [Rhodospirillales bacterium 69-11]